MSVLTSTTGAFQVNTQPLCRIIETDARRQNLPVITRELGGTSTAYNSNGDQLTLNNPRFSLIYTEKDFIVYVREVDGYLYRKYIHDKMVDDGIPITSISAYTSITGLIYIGDNSVIYSTSSGLYLKNIYTADTDNGTQITTQVSLTITYVENGEIVYHSNSLGNLYRKNIYEAGTGDGTQITSTTHLSPYITYIGNGEIVYRHSSGCFYRKNIYEAGTGDGTQITTQSGINPVYVGNGYFVYIQVASPYYMYKKNIYEAGTGDGTVISSIGVNIISNYIGNDEILFMGRDRYLYRKNINTTENSPILVSSFTTPVPIICTAIGDIVYAGASYMYRKRLW